MSTVPEGWVLCCWCREEWPPESFRAAGSATRPLKVCSACFEERYPKRRVKCCACGKKMLTRGANDYPTCRPCRAAAPDVAERARLQLTKRGYSCRCAEPGRGKIRGMCMACYTRDLRARKRAERDAAPLPPVQQPFNRAA